jgi:hypothetical protein
MENENINQQFRQEEISYIRRWDKEKNEYVSNPFPKIGGRLRLAHEQNEALSIETEIIRYDEKVAVVIATSKTAKGSFKGIGMASIERDQKLAHAILELAETRSIARSLRFAGYGIEYTSAEEMPLTENGNGNGGNGHPNDNLPPKGNRNGDNLPANGNRNGGSGSNNPGNGGNGSASNGGNNNGNGGGNGNGNNRPSGSDGSGNGNGRLSAKQFQYLQKLNAEIGRASADLDKQCLAMFGTVAQYLSKADASALINNLLAQ